MPTIVVGTAGHIDHGKTSLLRALTGIDTDRLPEERRRGMTIDVGYAHLDLDDGGSIDFVDVPGHDRLVGNMLVGAGEIDAALLVVAADDGPRAQTFEHLELLDALQIRDGLAVVTKIDAAEPARVCAVTEAVRQLLAGTSLSEVPVLVASSTTGVGIDEVRRELLALRTRVETRALGRPLGPPRLAIDRTFSIRGRGVVVTGSLRGGAIAVGDSVRVEPGGESARVRGLQVHNSERSRHDGGRTALNLAGAPADSLERGDVLTSGPGVESSDRLLVALRPATVANGPAMVAQTRVPPDGARLRFHLGTDSVEAVVGRRAREAAELPGGAVAAVLRLSKPVATFVGDRGVLRRASPGRAEAGVLVLDPRPTRGISRRRLTPERLIALAVAVAEADRAAAADALVGLQGAAEASRVAAVLAALRPPAAELLEPPARSGLVLAPDVEAALAAQAAVLVTEHHQEDPGSLGLTIGDLRSALLLALRRLVTLERSMGPDAAEAIHRTIESLVARGRLASEGDRIRDPARSAGVPPELTTAMDRLVALLDVPAPPPLDEAATAAGCSAEGLRALVTAGRIVRLGPDLAWATPAYHRLAGQALTLARVAPLTPATLRDATASSRRYVLAILEDLDRRGILRRTPEGHVPGPRAPRPTSASESAVTGSSR